VVTAAALVMSISFAALIAAQVSFMRMSGVGLTLAVLMDATLVRMLLVPAFMRVLGRANWVGAQTAHPTARRPRDQRGRHDTAIRRWPENRRISGFTRLIHLAQAHQLTLAGTHPPANTHRNQNSSISLLYLRDSPWEARRRAMSTTSS
jgi:MMPL family